MKQCSKNNLTFIYTMTRTVKFHQKYFTLLLLLFPQSTAQKVQEVREVIRIERIGKFPCYNLDSKMKYCIEFNGTEKLKNIYAFF